MDKEKIKDGVKLILEGIGEDISREGLLETPGRIARMYEEIFAGIDKDRTAQYRASASYRIFRIKMRVLLRIMMR